MATRVAVVGGGVSGLAAALWLSEEAARTGWPLELTLLEADSRLGGRILTEEFCGRRVDLGAESLLARDPETLAALHHLGLEGEVVRPGTTVASIWNGRRMVPIPKASSLGVPSRPWQWDVLRAVGPLGTVRVGLEPLLGGPTPDPDGPLGDFISARLGRRVLRQLVDPLLGGVYAGSATQLSIGAAAPQFLEALKLDRSLVRGLRRVLPNLATLPDQSPAPTFVTLRDGLGRLPDALGQALPAGSFRLGVAVRRVLATATGSVVLQTSSGADLEADGVILALPSAPAADLLTTMAPDLTATLRRQESSSVATITLAYPDHAFSAALRGSGFLVTRSSRRVVTAATFLDRKWPHLRQPGVTLLRASAGSTGDAWVLDLQDAALVSAVHNGLRNMLGLGALPLAARVYRWPAALPQYRAGHLGWKREVERHARALPVPLVLTGAAYNGVGVAACLRDGSRAGERLFARLTSAGEHDRGPSLPPETIRGE